MQQFKWKVLDVETWMFYGFPFMQSLLFFVFYFLFSSFASIQQENTIQSEKINK